MLSRLGPPPSAVNYLSPLTCRRLGIALFLGGIDSSMVATSLVTIGHEFNEFVKLQWIVLAYLLTYLGMAIS